MLTWYKHGRGVLLKGADMIQTWRREYAAVLNQQAVMESGYRRSCLGFRTVEEHSWTKPIICATCLAKFGLETAVHVLRTLDAGLSRKHYVMAKTADPYELPLKHLKKKGRNSGPYTRYNADCTKEVKTSRQFRRYRRY